jgi:hypothetical protein
MLAKEKFTEIYGVSGKEWNLLKFIERGMFIPTKKNLRIEK